MDSPNPYGNSQSFLNLLNSQEEISLSFAPTVDLASSQVPTFSTQQSEDRTSRRKWHPTEDVFLISSWLNTSKDPVVGNDQRAGAFWSRIANLFNSSPLLANYQNRTQSHFKKCWGRINDQTCKFVGSYEAALKEQSSGQNKNDVMKNAHQIFLNDHGFKYGLEHAWRELRHDQKWSSSSAVKDADHKKRKKGDVDSSKPDSDQPGCQGEETAEVRPPGVKSAKKAKGKKAVRGVEEEMIDFTNMWEIKQQDIAHKKMLSRQRMLEHLLARGDRLSEGEKTLKGITH
ncbi:glutathione S-transferase T3-like [Eutrema salsugineum]|uniref:glutathione S-transferase T3-like n=1 Tax=Eutrema salsugineum TaxID=72664 RepID=UPI000CECFFED|nr:glutathione S-transferase T3-like [Eutrema salsugineum]